MDSLSDTNEDPMLLRFGATKPFVGRADLLAKAEEGPARYEGKR